MDDNADDDRTALNCQLCMYVMWTKCICTINAMYLCVFVHTYAYIFCVCPFSSTPSIHGHEHEDNKGYLHI